MLQCVEVLLMASTKYGTHIFLRYLMVIIIIMVIFKILLLQKAHSHFIKKQSEHNIKKTN